MPTPDADNADPANAAPVAAPVARLRWWGWQAWSAVAAALVVGILLGPYVLRASQPLPLLSSHGRVIAIGTLERALLRDYSGAAESDGATSIGLSFRSRNGRWCRTFAVNPGPAGLACREWGEWVVELLVRNPRARQAGEGVFHQGGTPYPAAVHAAVQANIDGEPLTRDAEAALIGRAWRGGKP